MNQRILLTIAVIAVAVIVSQARADELETLAVWDVTGNSACASVVTGVSMADELVANDLTSHGVSLLKYPGYTEGAFVAKGWSRTDAPDMDKYFEFSLDVADGYAVTPEALSLSLSRGDYGCVHGAESWDLVASTIGFAQPGVYLGTASLADAGIDEPTPVSFDLSGLGAIQSGVTFRLYGYNDTCSSDYSGLNASWGPQGQDVILTGSASAVPEPATLGLLLVGGVMLWRRRRTAA